MEHPIIVQNLTKSFALLNKVSLGNVLRGRYPKAVVLDDITFSVESGELLGVMGRNGAGKSTLLRVLGGLYHSDSGAIAINGSLAAIFEMGTFMNVHQTGREYCHTYFDLMAGRRDVDDIIEEIKTFTELGDFFERPIHTYSSGMQAKLLFATATALPADIFLIDEVLVVGDEYFQGKAWKRIEAMLKSGTSGIIVSHDWISVTRLCRRGLLLKDHKIEFDGPALDLIRRYMDIEPLPPDVITIENAQRLTELQLTAEPDKDFSFTFDIEVCGMPRRGTLEVMLYIERLQEGLGWNQVFNCASQVDIPKLGRYTVTVQVPKLPLAPGEYFLSLELLEPRAGVTGQYPHTYARMNWLNGNPIRLTVPGENPNHAVLSGRLQWTM